MGDDRIYDSCQMLARVLKYAITEKESSYATFEEELENTERYLQLMNDLFLEVNPIPVKTALNLMGKEVGPFRLPLCEMSEAHQREMERLLREAGLMG